MKKMLIMSVFLFLAANASSASLIYVQSPQAQCLLCGPLCGSPCQLYFSPPFFAFELVISIRPDEKGVIGADLKVDCPASVQFGAVTENPLIVSSSGSIQSGLSFALSECQYSPFWTHQITCYLMNGSTGFICMSPYPDLGLNVKSCESGNPVYPASGAGVWLGLNNTWAAEETSWGAIKSLYSR